MNWWRQNGSIGFRWGEKGKWNLEQQAAGQTIELKLSLLDSRDDVVTVGFPYFGGNENPHFRSIKQDPVTLHQLPVKQLPAGQWRNGTGGQRL
ncbi:respiratory nitrate reductase subunit alpha [Klebsiella oxytoca]|nr:respiratory nitrate reductase subunit alpha [Klebsiella oxytoca]